jgi:FkbM family methyltransferase
LRRKLYSARLWRWLHAVFPLEQRLNPLLRRFYGRDGRLCVPWGRDWLTIDGAWLDIGSSASAPLYRGPRSQNPEFFAILAPCLETLARGTIVDVGANIGVYTLNFRCYSDAEIVAFEPDPNTFRLLQETLTANAVPRVSAFNLACGDDSGQLGFCAGINGSVASGDQSADETTPVAVIRLDDQLAGVSPISLIKVDCEGYEWHVLNGCAGILLLQRPLLFVELHPRLIGAYGHSVEEVCDLLRDRYDLTFWDFRPMQRSRTRVLRFLSRYCSGLKRLSGEAEALALAKLEPRPDQLFMLALPK